MLSLIDIPQKRLLKFLYERFALESDRVRLQTAKCIIRDKESIILDFYQL